MRNYGGCIYGNKCRNLLILNNLKITSPTWHVSRLITSGIEN